MKYSYHVVNYLVNCSVYQGTTIFKSLNTHVVQASAYSSKSVSKTNILFSCDEIIFKGQRLFYFNRLHTPDTTPYQNIERFAN